MDVNWSLEIPTEPGWYWVFGPEEEEPGIAMLDFKGHWYWPGFGVLDKTDFTFEWFMGPLEIPENPE